jgi:hypothetical protein
MKASDFDKRFEKGEDVSALLDMKRATRPGNDKNRSDTNKPQHK